MKLILLFFFFITAICRINSQIQPHQMGFPPSVNEIYILGTEITGSNIGKGKWYTGAELSSLFNLVNDHGELIGLFDDDHLQYALLAGRTGGQILIGGTANTDDLILQTTSGSGGTGADMIFRGGVNGGTEFMRILNSGLIGINHNAPTARLSISDKLRLFDATPISAVSTTKMGYLFNNVSPAGSILENTIDGDILSYAINVPQVGNRNINVTGGIFRLDTRAALGFAAGQQSFIVFGYPTGGSVASSRLIVSLQDGNTALNPTSGWTAIGHTAASAKLHILSTTEQFRSGYNTFNYWNATTASDGSVTYDAVGSNARFLFNDKLGYQINGGAPITLTGRDGTYFTDITLGTGLSFSGNTLNVTASGTSDHDWYKVGTTLPPDNINNDMFHLGKVGIGTDNPLAKLVTIDDAGIYSSNASSPGSPIGGSLYIGDNNFYNSGFYDKAPGLSAIYNADQVVASDLAFYSYNGSRVERMKILYNGNIGIGTSTPQQLLHVAGNARITGTDGIATTITGRDAENDITNVGLGDGLSISDGILSVNASPVPINDLLPADGTNTINNSDYQQEWQWNTLAGSGLKLTSSSSNATGHSQRLLDVTLTGANTAGSETTYAGYFSNQHTGTNPFNIGVYGQSIGTQGKGVLGASDTGVGVYGSSNSNFAVQAFSTNGIGMHARTNEGSAALLAQNFTASTNDVKTQITLQRSSSGVEADGIGGAIDYTIATSDNFLHTASRLISKWTNATFETRTSQFILSGVDNGTTSDLLTIDGDGSAQLNKYGAGNFTGIATYTLGVDASGNIIETTSSGGGGNQNLTIEGTGPTYDIAISDGTDVTIAAGGIVSLSESPTNTLIISATEVDGSTTNEIQTLTASGSTTTYGLDLSLSGGTVNLIEGNNITIDRSGNDLTINSSASGGMSSWLLAGGDTGGTESVTEGETVTFIGATGLDVTRTGSQIFTSIDISEYTTDATIEQDELLLSYDPSGANHELIDVNSLPYITTEVDGSVTNELQTLTNTGAGTTHTVTLSNGGGSFQLAEGGGLNIITSGSASEGIATLYINDESEVNEIQTLSATGSTNIYGIDLSLAGGTVNLIEGTGVTIDRTGNNLTINSSGAGDGNGLWTASNDNTTIPNNMNVVVNNVLSFDGTGTLDNLVYIDATSSRVGISNGSPEADLHVKGLQAHLKVEHPDGGATLTLEGNQETGQMGGISFSFTDSDYNSNNEVSAFNISNKRQTDDIQHSLLTITALEGTSAEVFAAEKNQNFTPNTAKSSVLVNAGVRFTQNYDHGTGPITLDRSYYAINVTAGGLTDTLKLPEIANATENWSNITGAQSTVGQEYVVTNFRASTNLRIAAFNAPGSNNNDLINTQTPSVGASPSTIVISPNTSVIIKCVRYNGAVGYWYSYKNGN
jgi:hypothetical protein